MTRLAIIEDDEVTIESLKMYVEEYSNIELLFLATSAESGIQQLQLADEKPDVLLLDIRLPGASGLQSIPEIKRAVPDIDIIMFTTLDDGEEIFEALCLGACSYISKRTPLPIIMDAIITVHNGGSYMSPSIARKVANHFMPKKIKHDLSDRQKDIVAGLVEGLSYKMIANKLNISIGTVGTHIKRIYKALEVNSSLEVVKKYHSGELS